MRSIRRGLSFALWGGTGVAAVELITSPWVTAEPVRFVSLLRFAGIDITLVGLGALFLAAPLCVLTALGLRTIRPADRLQAAWLWAGTLGALAYLAGSYSLTRHYLARRDPHLIALTLALLQLGLLAVVGLAVPQLATALRWLASRLDRSLGRLNPLGRTGPATLVMAVLGLATSVLVVLRSHNLRNLVLKHRFELYAAAAFLGAGTVGVRWLRNPFGRRKAIALAAWLVLAVLSLVWFGRDQQAKILAIRSDTVLEVMTDLVRRLSDVDGDGFGSLLGERDCAPFERKRNPSAPEIADNGIDENCNGRDLSTQGLPTTPPGKPVPVPQQYRQAWNILLVTIDTVRYDHTSLAGYARDTTPNLAKLAQRSVHFRFAQAPSAGTMASVPAIIVSKFFHSGIALGPERRPMPPKILPENTTLAEVMKTAGYRTGAILSHEYFNDWGLEQGFDSYDNELGKKSNPYGITSHDVTDRAEAWIAQKRGQRWFLWVHYIDPHGRYVAHPGDIQYGAEEMDLYDGELAYTDKHLGRLIDFISKSPEADRTVIALTSDHGDGFNEHGFINHAVALYRELLHVPLLLFVPDIEPRQVDGPVSPLDLFPTLADLVGEDVSALGLEGRSLVPQLFYGRDASDRVVFAETNLPEPQRAAISARYKIIHKLKSNVTELYDLTKDPWEKTSVAGKDKAHLAQMKAVLDDWLDRVYYSRSEASQAQMVRRQWLLQAAPKPEWPADATVAGELLLVGWDLPQPLARTGETVNVIVYLRCVAPPKKPYLFELEAQVAGAPTQTAKASPKTPGDGTFPLTRLQPGEYWREPLSVRLPTGWATTRIELRLRFLDERRQPAGVAGSQVDPDGKSIRLGTLPLETKPQAMSQPTLQR